ncbi:MAG TPA: hypothetical protein VMZ73_08640 [Acidimicrobiales bacterium]|nr:hypothetical protein [Acidimicrobiales bacterium]
MTEYRDLHAPAGADAEAPEADALDQAVAVDPDTDDPPRRISGDREAPEADALEQATAVPSPFDEYSDYDG